MIENDFDKWNNVKKDTHKENVLVGFRNRDIFYIKMGQNIGFEQNGKGDNFVRPVLIFKKFNKNMFFGIHLSTQIKEGRFYYNFNFLENKDSCALLVQAKTFDVKRLDRKVGTINKNDFEKLEIKFKKLIKL